MNALIHTFQDFINTYTYHHRYSRIRVQLSHPSTEKNRPEKVLLHATIYTYKNVQGQKLGLNDEGFIDMS